MISLGMMVLRVLYASSLSRTRRVASPGAVAYREREHTTMFEMGDGDY